MIRTLKKLRLMHFAVPIHMLGELTIRLATDVKFKKLLLKTHIRIDILVV